MAFYEHVLITRQDISPQQAEALNEELKTLIEGLGGHIAKIEYWGLRNLLYRIKKNRKGHYSLLAIDAPSAAVKEMERQLSLNEDVLRYLTLRVEQLDLELSPVLARRDRDRERRFDDDAGPRDSGPRDSGPRDSGPRDSGPRDGGPRDGGPREGLRDGGPRGAEAR